MCKLCEYNNVIFYNDDIRNDYLRTLIRGMKNRSSSFSLEREVEQNRYAKFVE